MDKDLPCSSDVVKPEPVESCMSMDTEHTDDTIPYCDFFIEKESNHESSGLEDMSSAELSYPTDSEEYQQLSAEDQLHNIEVNRARLDEPQLVCHPTLCEYYSTIFRRIQPQESTSDTSEDERQQQPSRRYTRSMKKRSKSMSTNGQSINESGSNVSTHNAKINNTVLNMLCSTSDTSDDESQQQPSRRYTRSMEKRSKCMSTNGQSINESGSNVSTHNAVINNTVMNMFCSTSATGPVRKITKTIRRGQRVSRNINGRRTTFSRRRTRSMSRRLMLNQVNRTRRTIIRIHTRSSIVSRLRSRIIKLS